MTREYIGRGSIRNLLEILGQHKPARIFLVTGKHAYEASGAKNIIGEFLADYRVTQWNDFDANPKLEDAKKGIQLLRDSGCDMVIAIGGGSVLDMAKLVNVLAVHKKGAQGYICGETSVKKQGKPLVAIPTTAGTGSEATHFAVCYIEKIKYSLAHEYLLPSYAIVDPQFTYSLSPYITVCTGMDAFAQALESYWNIYATDESKQYACEAICLARDNLVEAVNAPTPKARDAMSKAAYLAGKAINITKTTAPHAVSYPITSYFGVPHGHAVALTLPAFFLYNSESGFAVDTMHELAHLLGAADAHAAKKTLEDLMDGIGMQRSLSRLGVRSDADVEVIIQNANTERMQNNPRPVTKEFVRNLCKSLL